MTELRSRGYRSDVLYCNDDPSNLAVDVVRVWADQYDRYPDQCVHAPTGVDDDGWAWGNRFQYEAPAEMGAADLATRVIETIGADAR